MAADAALAAGLTTEAAALPTAPLAGGRGSCEKVPESKLVPFEQLPTTAEEQVGDATAPVSHGAVSAAALADS